MTDYVFIEVQTFSGTNSIGTGLNSYVRATYHETITKAENMYMIQDQIQKKINLLVKLNPRCKKPVLQAIVFDKIFSSTLWDIVCFKNDHTRDDFVFKLTIKRVNDVIKFTSQSIDHDTICE